MSQFFGRKLSGSLLGGVLVAALSLGAANASAQQPGQQQPGQPGQQQPGQGGGGGGGGGGQPQTLPYEHAADTLGFTRIFDGASLNGWDGNPSLWRVENGVLIGQTTAEAPIDQNTFLIFRGGPNNGVLRDFELKMDFRLLGGAGNSGVQVRSEVRPGAPHQWRLSGYQVDFDFNNQYTGMVYGEQAGQFLAPRGQITHIRPGGARPQQIGTVGANTDLRGVVNINNWNNLHIIFRGNTLTTIMNGRVTSVLIDDDVTAAVAGNDRPRAERGLVGLQLHTGPPMRAEFRNVMLKTH
jgi:hypothetical protein